MAVSHDLYRLNSSALTFANSRGSELSSPQPWPEGSACARCGQRSGGEAGSTYAVGEGATSRAPCMPLTCLCNLHGDK
ncbi:hypothetical protein AURDEDRAFT_115612 [Auricularia subglabra TFB-10046 SS5]|nr:hypothetical protein AURDEDRAFT_115612 [Auricularia subglabra TFB-10046 SS5]